MKWRGMIVAGAALGLLAAPATGAGLPEEQAAQEQAGSASLPPETLDKLLAPVALYPDQLLAQILLCAANPPKVGELDAWLEKNPSLKGTELQDAARQQGFEPSFVALALFPQVVTTMAADLAWTTKLGQAFTSDRKGVLASVQRLRAQSQDVGNLKSTPQQNVNTVLTDSGQQVIVIEPANPQVVYVPQYNPQVVYTQPAATTVVVQEDNDAGAAVAAGVVGFAAGIAIGAAVDNDYYYGPYGWRGGPYMYNDAWDDWYDDREDAREDWYEHREDAREDWQDQREDVMDERGERASTTQEQRTDRQQTRQENRPETQAERDQRRTEAQTRAQSAQAQGSVQAQGASGAERDARRAEAQANVESARSSGTATYEARGHERTQATSAERTGTRSSDAFSNYSSGKSERAASSRGQRSRSSGGGGRSRRR